MKKISLVLVIISILLSVSVAGGEKQPPVPSTFWGTVTIDGAPAPNGLTVQAFIDGVAYPQTTQTQQGVNQSGYYNLIVNGDDIHTNATKEGGEEGDIVVINVNGIDAPQTGVWHSGGLT